MDVRSARSKATFYYLRGLALLTMLLTGVWVNRFNDPVWLRWPAKLGALLHRPQAAQGLRVTLKLGCRLDVNPSICL